MQIEGVIVSVNYGDFLAHTLPENMQFFDRLVVVTHPDDQETQEVCRQYSVECVTTTCMHEDNDLFNKGRCINLGLGHLRGGGWVAHLDADIVLPHNFRDLIFRSKLEQKKIYGADRCRVIGYEAWAKHKYRRTPAWGGRYFIEPIKEFPLGARIVHTDHGYTPIGYFQLWHSSLGKRYPIHQGNAEHTDVLFAAQWSRQDRVLLPEVIVYHLESEEAEMAANWNGRRTKRFGPPSTPKQGAYCPDWSK
jgi:hypothetical protein